MGTDSTLTNEIYNKLYRAITHQELKPGQNLTLTMLKKQFNVSHTPIREALTRLSADGLVTYHPNKGMKVTDFSESEIREIFQFTAELEVLALRFCSSAFTLAPLMERLQSIVDREAEALEKGDFKAWGAISGTFHDVFYKFSDNRYLDETAEHMSARMELMSHMYSHEGTEEQIYRRHVGICNAVLQRDFDLAAERIRAHLQFSMMSVLDSYKKNR